MLLFSSYFINNCIHNVIYCILNITHIPHCMTPIGAYMYRCIDVYTSHIGA